MKKPNPSYIQVTKNFQPVLDTFASLLYKRITKTLPKSEKALRKLISQVLEQVLFPVELSSAKLKYKEPKLQLTKSGPLGNASYAAPKERQDYARRKPAKPYQPTPARQQQQARMQLAIAAWKSTDSDIQTKWNQAAIEFNFAGVHLFRGVYITLLIDNLPIPIPFLPTDELLKYYRSKKAIKS
jgi:hypothetical protein